MQRQQYLQEFIAHTNRNLFLTGKAGTGKTTLLHRIRKHTYKNCVIAAPTGIAALNAGGVTLHSLLQLPLGAFIPDSLAQLPETQSQLFVTPRDFRRHIHLQERKIRLIQAMELLVIDEVSMLRADTLDLVDLLLRSVRRSPLPFGGVQVLFIGDMLQLPPVVKPHEWQVLSQYYPSLFFFHAHVLQKYPPLYIELTHVYRQQDEQFLTLLNHLRYNELTSQDRQWLSGRIRRTFDPISEEGFVTLTTHNNRADEINIKALEALPGAYQDYHAQISGDFPEHLFPVEPMLRLKIGTRVMMLKNDTQTPRRYYNGMLGTVEEMTPQKLFVRLENDELLDVPLYTWENVRYQLDKESGDAEPEMLGFFKHFPVRLAWAITIHKSQGLTFDKAAIDLEAVFASGQAYVALSRLRSPEGLVLLSQLSEEALAVPPQIVDYERSRASDEELERTLASDKLAYWREQTLLAFQWGEVDDRFRQHAHTYRLESERSKKSSFGDWALEQSAQIGEMRIIADKFCAQLHQFFASGEEGLPQITERIAKASDYFLPRWRSLMSGLLLTEHQARGMKKVKEFQGELEVLHSLLVRTVRHLLRIRCCMEALSTGHYPDKEALQIEELLEAWLKEAKAEVKIPYTIPSEPKKDKVKEVKLSTQETTLQMLSSGKTIPEIATERALTESTIYRHLTQLLEEGKITAKQAGIDPARLKLLRKVFDSHDLTEGLKPIYDLLEGAYSYDELHLYLAAYRSIQTKLKKSK